MSQAKYQTEYTTSRILLAWASSFALEYLQALAEEVSVAQYVQEEPQTTHYIEMIESIRHDDNMKPFMEYYM